MGEFRRKIARAKSQTSYPTAKKASSVKIKSLTGLNAKRESSRLTLKLMRLASDCWPVVYYPVVFLKLLAQWKKLFNKSFFAEKWREFYFLISNGLTSATDISLRRPAPELSVRSTCYLNKNKKRYFTKNYSNGTTVFCRGYKRLLEKSMWVKELRVINI